MTLTCVAVKEWIDQRIRENLKIGLDEISLEEWTSVMEGS
jgi:hypothetical protein